MGGRNPNDWTVSPDFLGHQWETGLEMEQAEQEVVPLWDAGVMSSDLTCYAITT